MCLISVKLSQVWTSRHHEDIMDQEDSQDSFINAFNAYAPPGTLSRWNVTFKVVFDRNSRYPDLCLC